jgi:predicted O-methyltransferase YrrM
MLNTLKRQMLKAAFDRYYGWRVNEFANVQLIPVEYPVTPKPRYTPRGTVHEGLWRWCDAQRESCEDAIRMMQRWLPQLEAIPLTSRHPAEPEWNNIWFSALDGAALYSLVAERQPRRFVEVGSGNSTKFAAQAIRDRGLKTEVTSVDPAPRVEIDTLCQHVIREPLEETDQQLFRDLDAGDCLFIDNSHRAFTNSDVTTFFLEILPALNRGVLLHIHDIFIPWDYPTEWNDRFYSEQYLLASYLLGGPERLRLLLSNAFVSFDPALRRIADEAFGTSVLNFMCDPQFRYGGIPELLGTSVWFEVR